MSNLLKTYKHQIRISLSHWTLILLSGASAMKQKLKGALFVIRSCQCQRCLLFRVITDFVEPVFPNTSPSPLTRVKWPTLAAWWKTVTIPTRIETLWVSYTDTLNKSCSSSVKNSVLSVIPALVGVQGPTVTRKFTRVTSKLLTVLAKCPFVVYAVSKLTHVSAFVRTLKLRFLDGMRSDI